MTFSMRLAHEDALALDRLALDLREVVGRRVDRIEVMREAAALVLNDDKLRERLAANLLERRMSRGLDIEPLGL